MLSERLRVVDGDKIGTTAFFRNRVLLDTLFPIIAKNYQDKPCKILFHACSIGAEPYSFILYNELNYKINIDIYATDINENFVNFSKQGDYPSHIINGMKEPEKKWFSNQPNGLVSLPKEIKQQVTFLPPSSFTDFATNDVFDVVFILNALVYVDAYQQASTLDQVASYNSDLLIITGFHQNTIKADLQRNEYKPTTHNIELIHDGWVDRRGLAPYQQLPPNIKVDPSLPAFSKIADYEYKYGAIFRKS